LAKILVIEDNENIRFLFEEFLTYAGHDVRLAENGIKGLEILQTNPLPDIILLDLIMPNMDGSTVAKNISADERLSKIPIVIISGSTDAFKKPLPNNIYCAYITKPFDLDDVLETIDKFTNHKLVNESSNI